MTSNQAEYEALIKGLDLCMGICRGELTVFSDSELLVQQLAGVYRIRSPKLRALLEQIKTKEKLFQKVQYSHIKKEENFEADRLSNEAIDKKLLG